MDLGCVLSTRVIEGSLVILMFSTAEKLVSTSPEQHVHLAKTISLHVIRFYFQVLVTQTHTHKKCVSLDIQPKGTFSSITISITQLHTCTSIHQIPVCARPSPLGPGRVWV